MQDLHSTITRLCINHFNSLPKTGKPGETEWTVLSCIVKQNIIKNHFEIVSLGSGSKCIGKSKMSPSGDILNDSHAEVICRRTFLLYIYEELNLKNSEIFTLDCDNNKYCLKDTINFHFFTTHVPCGDAAIFPKQNREDFGELIVQTQSIFSKRPAENASNGKSKQIKLDIYRTGAKCLPADTKQDLHSRGIQYHTIGAVRTKPGRGDPTLSVSCSDKMAKWCYLGIQGALLSIFLKQPIYLSSFTIAGKTPFCKIALSRALFGKSNLVDLKFPFQHHKIEIEQDSDCFEFSKREARNPCPSSIVWYKTNSRPLEVAVEGKKQGVTKKKQNTKAGRLRISKIEIFRVFLNTVEHLNPDVFVGKDLSKLSYKEAKTAAHEYQEAWDTLKRNGFKLWTVKDDSLLNFVID